MDNSGSLPDALMVSASGGNTRNGSRRANARQCLHRFFGGGLMSDFFCFVFRSFEMPRSRTLVRADAFLFLFLDLDFWMVNSFVVRHGAPVSLF